MVGVQLTSTNVVACVQLVETVLSQILETGNNIKIFILDSTHAGHFC